MRRRKMSSNAHPLMPVMGSAVLYALIATTAGPTAGLADDQVPSKAALVGEATLDFDKDGKPDRAVLMRNVADASVDLIISFGAGDDTHAVSRSPTVRKNIAEGAAVSIESGHRGGLTIKYGCGGCSNDTETELRLVYRGGRVLIGGYTLDWDTRAGIGRCDVNFLTGRGFVAHGLGRSGTPFRVRSGPIALSAWSDDMVAKICP